MLLARVARSFLRHFPVPGYLSEPAIGCDVSDHAIHLIELAHEKDALDIVRSRAVRAPEGVIVNGDIRDRDAVIDMLKTLKREEGMSAVHFSLPVEKSFLFTADIPGTGLDAQTIRSVCEFKLEENIPIAPDNALFDHTTLFEDLLTATTRVSVAVAGRDTVASYVSVLEDAGITPLSCEVESDAIARAVVPRNMTGAIMAVDFGAVKTGISIVHRGSVLFTSTLDFGSDDLTKALAKDLSLAHGDAEELKRTYGLARGSDNKRVSRILLEHLSILRNEINRYLLYWKDEERDPHGAIGHIILSGGGANLNGIVDYLSVAISVPTVIADVWTNVFAVDHRVPGIPFEESLTYATAIGLALRQFTVASHSS